MNTHYVCKGLCGSESSTPGICPTEDCVKSGKSLIECKCEDGLHGGIGGGMAEPEESLEEQLDNKAQFSDNVSEEEEDTDGPLNFEN